MVEGSIINISSSNNSSISSIVLSINSNNLDFKQPLVPHDSSSIQPNEPTAQ